MKHLLFISFCLSRTVQSQFQGVGDENDIPNCIHGHPSHSGYQHYLRPLYLICSIPWPALDSSVNVRDTEEAMAISSPLHVLQRMELTPVLTSAVIAALDSLAENWVSGIYLSGLSSGPKIVRVISLILAILLQCYCPSLPCKHGRKLSGPHTFSIVVAILLAADMSRHVRYVILFHSVIAKGFN